MSALDISQYLRLFLRLSFPLEIPKWSTFQRWNQSESHWAHVALYGVMLLLPISGWLHDSVWKDPATHPIQLFGLVPWPRIGWIMSIEPATKEMPPDAFGLLHTVAA